jgi:hypothetical protein
VVNQSLIIFAVVGTDITGLGSSEGDSVFDSTTIASSHLTRSAGGAAHENVCNFVSGYPFQLHPGCRSKWLRSGVPLYDFRRVRSRWLGHWSQGMERMPCHDTPASSLPDWLHLEASPTGLWADRQGLALGSRKVGNCYAGRGCRPCDKLSPSHVSPSQDHAFRRSRLEKSAGLSSARD